MRALDWNALQFVLALARHGALEGAAEDLGVDPSTVSRRVRALESALGARVFDRTLSGHRLTPVGAKLAETAEHVAADIAGMEREAARADDRLLGTVRIATSDAVGRLFVSPFVARFHREHPLVDFQIMADQRAADLVRREADMAIRFVRTAQAQLVSRRLATIGHGLYASREYLEAHPFGGDEPLRGHVLLGYHESLARMPEARWLDERAAGSRFAVRANRADALLVTAASGMGLAVLPCYVADPEPRLVRLLGPEAVVRREVWLVMHRDLRRIARFRAFADHLASEFGKLGPALQGDAPTGGEAEVAPAQDRSHPRSKRPAGADASR
jgi:DNA-binding transcriptional LysR family regulator